VLRTLGPQAFCDERFGAITVRDVLAELEKPGRDPRPDFKVARFNDGVDDIEDLRPGMVLEGTVTNVAQFGAFVDLGVHQDGLVHVSQLADTFVSDARQVVRAGALVKVRVLEVDLARKRIALTMRQATPPAARRADEGRSPGGDAAAPRVPRRPERQQAPQTAEQGAMAAAFARLREGG
jgi:uncharacterized protein